MEWEWKPSLLVFKELDSKTKPFGEKELKIVKWDIKNIVKDDLEELEVKKTSLPANQHYTDITLTDLNRIPQGQTIKKWKLI